MNKDKDDAVAQGTPYARLSKLVNGNGAMSTGRMLEETIEELDKARVRIEQLEAEVAALSAQHQGTIERLGKAFEELTRRETRIMELSAQVVELQDYVKNLQAHRQADGELIEKLMQVYSSVTRASVPPSVSDGGTHESTK